MAETILRSILAETKSLHIQRSKRIGFLGTAGLHALLIASLAFGPAVAEVQPVAHSDAPLGMLLASIEAGDGGDGAAAAEPMPLPQEEAPTPVEEETPTPVPETGIVKKQEPRKKKKHTRPQASVPAPKNEAARADPAPDRGEGQGGRPGGPVANEARQTLLSRLVGQIEKHKRYPTAARRLNLEGTVFISVRLNLAGIIQDVRIDAQNVHPVLQKAAEDTMNKVQAHWQPQAQAEAMLLVVPLRFTLTGTR